MVTLTSKPGFDFIPHKAESLRVVKDYTSQHQMIRYPDNAAIIEVATHPITGFHQHRPQKGNVNNVSSRFVDLNPITDAVNGGQSDHKRACNACNNVLEGDNNAGAKQT